MRNTPSSVLALLAALLTVLLSAAALPAQCGTSTVTFGYSGTMQTWTVPPGVLEVSIVADGAAGGSAGVNGAFAGGRGARVSAKVPVDPGATLGIVVGGRGTSYSSGGGGGGATMVAGASTWVAFADPLVVAAGGGGGGALAGGGGAGGSGWGGNGLGGFASPYHGGASGGGVIGVGLSGFFFGTLQAFGGHAAVHGAGGGLSPSGRTGGFGCGGGATAIAGGGGGGYSGGKGSFSGSPATGGTSYWAPTTTEQSNVAGGNPGVDGRVTITWRPAAQYDYTGGLQTYTVPAGVDMLRVRASGAAGARANFEGGWGGTIEGLVPVQPGQILVLLVGERGREQGGGGGSFVAIGTDASAFATPLLVAGGGGGASWETAFQYGGRHQAGGNGGALGGTGTGGGARFGGGGGGALTAGGSNHGVGGDAAVAGGAGGVSGANGNHRGGYGGGGSGCGVVGLAKPSGGGGGGYGGGRGGRGDEQANPNGLRAYGGTSYHDPAVTLVANHVGGNPRRDGWIHIQPVAPSAASVTVRAGGNPVALTSNDAPVLGTTWTSRIGHGTFVPNALLDGLVISLGSDNQPTPTFGTLLCDLYAPHTTLLVQPGADFAVALPAGCQYVLLSFYTQGFSIDGSAGLSFTNALDLLLSDH